MFNANIIKREIQDISEIPDDSPSNPSIKFIAFVIPTIHINVINIESPLLNPICGKLETLIASICKPKAITITAAKTCPNNF